MRYPSPETFFTLSNDYEDYRDDEIFYLATYSRGGFPYEQIMRMPLFRRRRHLKRLIDDYKKQNKRMEELSNNMKSNKLTS